MNKFEKLIEYIINDEDDKARELFHNIVVEKSRDIYESIMDEEQMGEEVHGDQVGDMVDEISGEESMGEADEEFGGDDDMVDGDPEGDMEDGDDAEGGFGGGEEAEHAEIEDQVMNIDAKLDELLAKFDEIMGDEGHGEMGGMEEPAGEMGGDEGDEMAQPEENGMFEGEQPEWLKKGSGKSGSGASGSAKSGKSGSAKMEAAKAGSAVSGKSGASGKSGSGKTESRKSTSELMREYVDRIGDIYGGQGDASEGDAVGATGKKTSVNTKPGSVGPGADFGGTEKNLNNGGANETPDGKSIPKPSNEYNKGQGEIKSGNINVPGGKAGGAFKTKEGSYETDGKGQGSESGTKVGAAKDGKVSVNKKSELGQAGQPTGKK